MDIGKLPPDVLARLIEKAPLDSRVIVGPRVGEDAAVIDFGDKLLVAKTDPITFATDKIGWYAVNINANDLAVSGADAKWFMATVLLPEGASEKLAEDIFIQMVDACMCLGVSLVGGHTEITYGLDRPIVIGSLFGETTRERLVTSGGAKPGDIIAITHGIAIEGTSVLAREARDELVKAGVSQEILVRAENYLVEPGISVVDAAKALTDAVKVTAMHDPTEGGLATGIVEVASASGVGVDVELDAIPVLPECAAVCKALGLDPLGLLASGSLLFTCRPEDSETAVTALENAAVKAHVIGRVTPVEEGLIIRKNSRPENLPIFSRDEIARFFSDRR